MFSETVPVGVVYDTDPKPTERVREGGTVTLILSKGPERFEVPALVGSSQDDAEQALADAGLAVGAVSKEYSDTVPKGDVIRTNPKEGASLRADTAVRLTVSKGVQPVTVPNLVGQESTAAQATLTDLGLKPQVTGEKFSSTVPKGSVLQQSPKGGTVDKGSEIELVVSRGPKLFEVPNVFGKRTNEAVSILEGAGFTVKIEKILGGIFGQVRSQSPGGGSMQPKGTEITIRII